MLGVTYIKIFVFLTLIVNIFCASPCEVHKTCGDCIKDLHLCAWCSKDDFKGTRCRPASELSNSGCDKKHIESPESKSTATTSARVTQMKPHRYDMTLRPGDTLEFDITYKEREHYPVDLYFLIDESQSMYEIKQSIAEKSQQIYNAMYDITKDVLLGMGGFCDKDTAPYQKRNSTTQQKIYSFKNHMSMTKNTSYFQSVVAAVGKLGNYDGPEGGFDGLAQVMACHEEIGWRSNSRKIIIFVTDSLSHSAGDGRFAGIIQPYDGKCHTKNGIYEKQLQMDYPSLSILNKMAIEGEMTIIFTVPSEHINHYGPLKHSIQGSRVISFQKKDGTVFFSSKSKSFSAILSQIYEEISSTIRLRINEESEYVKLTFSPDCTTKSTSDNQCNIERNQEMRIKGHITLLRYYNKSSLSIDIGIEGIVEEKVILNISVPGCACEMNSQIEQKSQYCQKQGLKKCGLCECYSGWIGERCACKQDGETKIDEASCRPPNSSNDTLPCSGYGDCICGQCHCRGSYDGQYCQCNKDSCRNKCSGHGDCSCGKCNCHVGWEGEDCSCSTAGCPQTHGKECNDRGTCKCRQCKCKDLASWDARPEQHEELCVVKSCSNCQDKQCELLTECAICHINRKPGEHCLGACAVGIHVETYSTQQLDDQIQQLDNSTTEGGYLCENVKVNSIGCYTRFFYRYNDLHYTVNVLVQSETDCNQSYYWFGGVALGTLVLAGLLTLIAWKVLAELQDRREYRKFMKAQAYSSAPRLNPIFEPASTTFSNPAFKTSQELI